VRLQLSQHRCHGIRVDGCCVGIVQECETIRIVVLGPGREGFSDITELHEFDVRERVGAILALDCEGSVLVFDDGVGAALAREHGDIIVGATVEHVVAGAALQKVVAGPAEQLVAAALAVELVAAALAVELRAMAAAVIAAGERVGEVRALQHFDVDDPVARRRAAIGVAGQIDAHAARLAHVRDQVPALAAVEHISPRTAIEPVVAGAAIDRVVAVAAMHGVVAGPAVERVGAVAAVEPVVALAAEQTVLAGAADQGVVAATACRSVPRPLPRSRAVSVSAKLVPCTDSTLTMVTPAANPPFSPVTRLIVTPLVAPANVTPS
jgi:hypothetical protein